MFPVREDEPGYAKLPAAGNNKDNRYGDPIQLLPDGDNGVSLRINDDPEIGTNPNRTRQHGFHFTADNCIGCHACEAACSEKNDLPPHLAFRSVGYVEGGSFPDYHRMNISMACNHCDDPVCLKGCPTRAYTKHPEYGAVIQDPNICFGCGYCTWVCPYNAPQLDPVAGQVEKCNMCVDRLEVGLKPACVSACLGNALDFGVIEDMPNNREQISTEIPGFPDTSITHPNIRFQQTKTLPREVTRTDSMPVKYKMDNDLGVYKPQVDQKAGKKRSWNIGLLNSRENPLVLFTLGSQAAVGALVLLVLGTTFGIDGLLTAGTAPIHNWLLFALLGLQAVGLFMSTVHLGKPIRFYRGFNNLRHSPVSREGLGIAVFMAGLGGSWFFSVLYGWRDDWEFLYRLSWLAGMVAGVAGLTGLYYMGRCYRIPARPFWNHWQVFTSFFGTALYLGAIVIGAFAIPSLVANGLPYGQALTALGTCVCLGLVIDGFGVYNHARDMNAADHEGAASQYILSTTFGNTYYSRNALFAFNLLAAVALTAFGETLFGVGSWWVLAGWVLLAISVLLTSAVGRALFYILVIPTTMPGAFFWKNKAFEQHARDIGLADMPQVGVAPDVH